MIKPEQVPMEVAEAGRAGWRHGPKDPVAAFQHAIAAAINAWPGVYTEPEREYGKVIGHTIFLPLPIQQETDNG